MEKFFSLVMLTFIFFGLPLMASHWNALGIGLVLRHAKPKGRARGIAYAMAFPRFILSVGGFFWCLIFAATLPEIISVYPDKPKWPTLLNIVGVFALIGAIGITAKIIKKYAAEPKPKPPEKSGGLAQT